MIRIRTPFTELLGCASPIVSAPMAGASGGALAGAVSAAGGFGFMQAGYEPVDKLEAEIAIARTALQTAVNEPLNIGVGFLGWVLDKNPDQGRQLVLTALKHRVTAVWLSFGEDLGKWIQVVRDGDTRRADDHKTLIFVQSSSVKDILMAVKEWRVDVVVVQGIESGGHGLSSALPLLSLVPTVSRALAAAGYAHIPVLAAGGLATGSQVAATLTLGASAAVLGTRFLLSPQSMYSTDQKDALRAASAESTLRTQAFDWSRGTLGWPAGIDGRGLRNKAVEEAERGASLEELQRCYAEAMKDGSLEWKVTWAGQGIGLMSDLMDASDIVRTLHGEVVQRLQTSANLV